jgi:tight adherence protein B
MTFLGIVWMLKRAAFERAERFERDYPSMLIAIASSVRTGSDPLIAMQQARNLFAPDTEVHRELEQFAVRVERGDSEESSIRHFGSTIDHPDIALFRAAFLLSRKEGSSLGKCLHRLARVTRNRQSFRRKVRAAVAMQKLSSFGIAGCALLIVGFQAVASQEALVRALEHPLGSRMLGAALCLVLAGLIGMLRMSRAKI